MNRLRHPGSFPLTLAFAGLTICELGRLAVSLVSGTTDLVGVIEVVGGLGFVLLCLVGVAGVSLREKILFGVATGLTVALALKPNAWENIFDGLGLAAYFGVFIAMLTVLKVSASRSQSVTDVGVFLTSRAPGRRFFSVAFGAHVLGVFLNFSAVSLMSPLIQNGARAVSAEHAPLLERRQLSALIRGFSWILLWAPTTLAQAVLLRIFTEISYPRLLVLGIATSILMILIGRAFDRFEWRAQTIENSQHLGDLPGRSLLIVGLVCGALLTMAYLGVFLTGFNVAEALMFVAPFITVMWLHAQRRACDGAIALQPVSSALSGAVPELARSAIALGLSGYIGRTAAQFIPTTYVGDWVMSVNPPEWVFLAVLPVLITLGGQVALSPIVFVVFFGQVIAGFPALPADPTLMVFSLSVGWALSMAASPNATATLLISATTGIAPTTLTWKWNLRYALGCYLAFVVICVGLTL